MITIAGVPFCWARIFKSDFSLRSRIIVAGAEDADSNDGHSGEPATTTRTTTTRTTTSTRTARPPVDGRHDASDEDGADDADDEDAAGSRSRLSQPVAARRTAADGIDQFLQHEQRSQH